MGNSRILDGWSTPKCRAGTPVRVRFGCFLETTGILLTDYGWDAEYNEMPRIVIISGAVLLGNECWWIPECEVAECEASDGR